MQVDADYEKVVGEIGILVSTLFIFIYVHGKCRA